LAESISVNVGAELHVAHAYRAGPAATVFGFDLQKYEQELAIIKREHLDALVGNHTINSSTTHLLHQLVAEVIPQYADRDCIDVIVMGTVSRGGIPGLLIGNTTEGILDRVSCDVLLIKPTGFITPIELVKNSREKS
jgi:universal stress protein E